MTTDPNLSQNDETKTVNLEVVSTLTKEPAQDLAKETLALIDTIRTKAISEAKEAGDFARDNYLTAVRRIREDIETRKLFNPERIDEAVKQLQKEVEKDWEGIVKEMTTFGDRLNEAAKTAWEILTAPRNGGDNDPKNPL
ncbi:hypothetical protein [Aphanothece sacrum]|uniref:Uncharacterized protein n=1 Tax=Aphanothece sacrum FPU1 TaxID=1920663 RepID=A0A401ILR0_APHSA|nr:hypothetical protein [Aphanothece sacrum]GBF82200.1 hypothetical protein AsFPU1_3628 [Aphanothece sacrum FPU1]GBF87262.1 drug resistance MFS transporter [Aphanothece sacrum FPU3]